MKNWQSRSGQLKNGISTVLLKMFALLGYFARRGSNDYRTEVVSWVPFAGDVPKCAGDEPVQGLLRYAIARPASEAVRDIVYSPLGFAWHGGTLIERYSSKSPHAKGLIADLRGDVGAEIASATIIESETPYTYGDWVGDFVLALIHNVPLSSPLILPADMAGKSYVVRDCRRLGVEVIAADRPTRIANATILRKRSPSYYWTSDDVAAYRARFGFTSVAPEAGSVIYLSRRNVTSEAVERPYPSSAVEAYVASIGGRVFDTTQASPEAFAALASQVETVIADQGSAIFGVLQWQVKHVIEITNDWWWHNSNLMFAHASGVERYSVVVCNDKTDAQVVDAISALLAAGRAPPSDHGR